MSAVLAMSGVQATMCASPAEFMYLLADEQPSVMLGICHMLADAFSIAAPSCRSTSSAEALVDACTIDYGKPVIAVIDPSSSPFTIVRSVLAANPAIRIVVYSADESPFLAKQIIAAGASGYVTKKSPLSCLVEAITAVACGATYVESRVSSDRAKSHPWSKLTSSERSVLLAFASGRNAQEICWETGRSYSTVTSHKYNGLHKLGLRNGSALRPYLIENGLSHELIAGDDRSS